MTTALLATKAKHGLAYLLAMEYYNILKTGHPNRVSAFHYGPLPFLQHGGPPTIRPFNLIAFCLYLPLDLIVISNMSYKIIYSLVDAKSKGRVMLSQCAVKKNCQI